MELVGTFREAEENSVRFFDVGNFASTTVFSRLGKFFHWYYFPGTDVFAPSKFIGYKNTTLESYSGDGTGTDTQRVLGRWFHKLDKGSPMYTILESKLSSFLSEHGFSLSQKAIDGTGGI